MSRGSRTAARRLELRRILRRRRVTHQRQLVELLRRAGYEVTQTTVSRDLAAVGARKHGGRTGRYLLPDEGGDVAAPELAERLRQFVLEIDSSGNLAVIKTPPGSAHSLAVAIDRAPAGTIPGLLATLAGDDTILAVARSSAGGAALARRFQRLLQEVP